MARTATVQSVTPPRACPLHKSSPGSYDHSATPRGARAPVVPARGRRPAGVRGASPKPAAALRSPRRAAAPGAAARSRRARSRASGASACPSGTAASAGGTGGAGAAGGGGGVGGALGPVGAARARGRRGRVGAARAARRGRGRRWRLALRRWCRTGARRPAWPAPPGRWAPAADWRRRRGRRRRRDLAAGEGASGARSRPWLRQEPRARGSSGWPRDRAAPRRAPRPRAAGHAARPRRRLRGPWLRALR